ncbi:MAG: hypothetical protein JZU65_12800 [Chlorobium sp.]|nr:hypothetical protein [Chlorobium sp.]
MTQQALAISFSNPASSETDSFVLLEQEPIPIYTNYLTKAGVVRYLSAKLSAQAYVSTNCGDFENGYPTTIYAYPYPQNLGYRLGISSGSIEARAMAIVSFQEDLQCNLETTLKPKYPVLEIMQYDWVGEVYNRDGQAVAKPAVSVVANGLTLAEPVYGTLVVTYKVMQHSYPAYVPKRGLKNKLQSFAWAVWTGGNTMLELEPPDGAEDGTCQDSTASGIGSIEHVPSGPDYVESHDETHHIDYCTMECTDCDES